MTTPHTRALVSLAVTTTVILTVLTLGACTGATSRSTLDPAPVELEVLPLSIRFDNDAREYVHVYLVGQERQWLLGRVEPGQVRTLKIPEESLHRSSRSVQLAVIAGDHPTVEPLRNPRARTTVVQPVAFLVSQQWTFAQGELTSLKIPSVRVGAGHQ